MVKQKYDGLTKFQKGIVWVVVTGAITFSGGYLSSGAIKAHENCNKLETVDNKISAVNQRTDFNAESVVKVGNAVSKMQDDINEIKEDVGEIKGYLKALSEQK